MFKVVAYEKDSLKPRFKVSVCTQAYETALEANDAARDLNEVYPQCTWSVEPV
jgi:hypothetical protein